MHFLPFIHATSFDTRVRVATVSTIVVKRQHLEHKLSKTFQLLNQCYGRQQYHVYALALNFRFYCLSSGLFMPWSFPFFTSGQSFAHVLSYDSHNTWSAFFHRKINICPAWEGRMSYVVLIRQHLYACCQTSLFTWRACRKDMCRLSCHQIQP